ncbi:MAG: Rrf2 family transcriptional regulator [Clostridia bacterium]|nr:Rrf2 family transcriptional regulator [Clostridia bacterium]
MKLSSKTHYGLMACHILAENYPDNTVSASALESRISVSGKYLEKIMRMLSARGIITANRGASGGYFLAKPPEEIKIGEIVRALEDDMQIIGCVAKDGACRCPSQAVWKRLYDGINEVLDGMTLQQMLDGDIQGELNA